MHRLQASLVILCFFLGQCVQDTEDKVQKAEKQGGLEAGSDGPDGSALPQPKILDTCANPGQMCTEAGGKAPSDLESFGNHCDVFNECLSMRTQSSVGLFPEFTANWCADRFNTADPCGILKGSTTKPEDVLQTTKNILAQLGAGRATLTDGDSWKDCGDVATCDACTDGMHRGGNPLYQVTSHKCMWDGGSCVDAIALDSIVATLEADFESSAIHDRDSCPENAARLDTVQISQSSSADSLAEFSNGSAATCCCKDGECSASAITGHTKNVFEHHNNGQVMCCTMRDHFLSSCDFGHGYSNQVDANLCTKGQRQTRRKLALLIGYSYSPGMSPLAGTFPDILRSYITLTTEKGFAFRDITILTDNMDFYRSRFHRDVNLIQTNKNVGNPNQFLGVMNNFVRRAAAGDYVFFHYAGHGTTLPENGGGFMSKTAADELDGWDEALVTPNGEVVYDDDFYKELLKIPRGVTAFIMVDACHSEGFSDLPFNYIPASRKKGHEEHNTWCTDWLHPREVPLADITYVAGSQNHETSADLGNGGALSITAEEIWKTPTRLAEAWPEMLRRLSRTQEPSLSAYPTFRDYEVFDPYDPYTSVQRDPAGLPTSRACGRNPCQFQAPHICNHGGIAARGNNHFRKDHLVLAATQEFVIRQELDPASSDERLPHQGWVRPA